MTQEFAKLLQSQFEISKRLEPCLQIGRNATPGSESQVRGVGFEPTNPSSSRCASTLRDGSLSPTPLTRLPADCSGRPPRNANPILPILKTLPTRQAFIGCPETSNSRRRSSGTKVKSDLSRSLVEHTRPGLRRLVSVGSWVQLPPPAPNSLVFLSANAMNHRAQPDSRRTREETSLESMVRLRRWSSS